MREVDVMITFDEFKKIELKVGRVRKAERIDGAGKLIKLVVDIGTEERQLVAGIADYYAPEALVGKNIVVLANLEPKMIRGIPSNGMILAADGGKIALLTVEDDVLPGTPVR